jgi:hypothetical protein
LVTTCVERRRLTGNSSVCISSRNGRHKAIPLAGKRFDESWIVSGVAEDFPQLVDDRVQAMIKVNERSVWPEVLAQFVARKHFAGALEQENQDLERLIWQAQADASFAKFTGSGVRFKNAEAKAPRRSLRDHCQNILA